MGIFDPKEIETMVTETIPGYQLGLTEDIFRKVGKGLKNVPKRVIPASKRVPKPNADILAGRKAARTAAQNLQGTAPLRRLARQTAKGKFLDPATNPFLERTAKAATRPIEEELFQRALPGIRSASVSAGAFGGNREDLIERQLLNDATRNVGDIRAKIFADNFARERAFQMAAPQMYGDIANLELLPGQVFSGIGKDRLAFDQARIAAEQAELQDRIMAPWRGLDIAAPLVLNRLPGTSVSKIAETGTSPAGDFFKGALGGGLTGAVLADQFGLFDELGAGSSMMDWLKGLALPGGAALVGGLGSLM